MQEWLYGKGGYYSKLIEIGKSGDFYTSVRSSMFFGGSIAKRVIKTIESGFLSKNCHIVEIGAHRGYLLADIIQFIYTLKPTLLESLEFVIIEPFEQNRIAQKSYFKDSFGDSIKLKHDKNLKEAKFDEAFFVANEIYDSFACELIKDGQMLHINNHIPYFDTISHEINKIAKKYGLIKGEIAIGIEEFAKDMANSAKRFEFVTFDYGEKYPRGDISLRVYKNHKVYPFFELTHFVSKEDRLAEFYKVSDITYDVDFKRVSDSFSEIGCKEEFYATQLFAMVEFGIVELLEILRKNVSEEVYQKELAKAKPLIEPTTLGERFKCLIIRSKDES